MQGEIKVSVVSGLRRIKRFVLRLLGEESDGNVFEGD